MRLRFDYLFWYVLAVFASIVSLPFLMWEGLKIKWVDYVWKKKQKRK